MDHGRVIVGFIGAGGIARSHAFSLDSLKYYYKDCPGIERVAVCSVTKESRELFAKQFGFSRACDFKDFISDGNIDTVFILGPNNVHYEHLKATLGMKSIKRVYIEKPVCSNPEEEKGIIELTKLHPNVRIQVGFQYLFTAAVREALILWKSGKLGKPIHFDLKYYHSDYLKKAYREKRTSRLAPAPDGGAMADLGSHIISILIAFLGERVRITGAFQAGAFDDVPEGSDLYSQIFLYEEETNAVGTVSSSRISSGSGDDLSFEIYASKGAIKYSSASPGFFEYYTEESGLWTKQATGSSYEPATTFPSKHVPGGWHRSMIHAHYVFLTGTPSEIFVPDIRHGLIVQKLLLETTEHLAKFREKKNHLFKL